MALPIYGYMRIATDADCPAETERVTAELETFARQEGFSLEDVFIEHLGAKNPAFDGLIERLKRSETRNVLVPSLWHFARLPGLQEAMRQHIQSETGAHVWVVQGKRW
ncbi:hypothetical protein ABH920_001906 [Catenulispora sp. EB89]|uniref:recombinase family protein n=1 Tax=Catenulispora sp. EB89 TaxID=3156257 RepID=UPI0035177A8D